MADLVRLFSAGGVAAEIGRPLATLVSWERKGWISPAARLEGSGRRFFTDRQLEEIRQFDTERREARREDSNGPQAA